MRKISQLLIAFTILSGKNISAQSPKEELKPFTFGAIKPTGWLKTQMQKDLNGFVGNLDRLIPELINDPIYGSGRLQKQSKAKDLGNLKSGDAEGDEQYKWWNSETQSNWWDGFIRNAFLLGDNQAIAKVDKHVESILATQDADGYLGIYDKELRYKFQAENGELWSKTTLYRGLLVYYEYTKNPKILSAVVKAVENLIQNYPINASHPFYAGNGFSGGVGHGLTFTDVLDRLHFLTKDKKYLDYATFLYEDFSNNHASEKDAQLKNILDPSYKLQSHGVHSYEHMRPLIVAAFSSNSPTIQKALTIYLSRIQKVTTLTGGATGDEWIWNQQADATHTGYEFCSLHELMDSYALLLQKTGDMAYANKIENIFFNAAQGARHPELSSIAYLKTDNSYEMLGTKNGEIEPNRKQTRYKYSPVHQDVAVCCVPNAGRISPYFLQNAWFKQSETTLVAALLMPNVFSTDLNGNNLVIENQTEYPNANQFTFNIKLDSPQTLTIKIRKPTWVNAIKTQEKYRVEGNFIVFNRLFKKTDQIKLAFDTNVRVLEDANGEHCFAYGALIYALPIEHIEEKGRKYAEGFEDTMYKPTTNERYSFEEQHKAAFSNGYINVNLKNKTTNKIQPLRLVPMNKTILRQVNF